MWPNWMRPLKKKKPKLWSAKPLLLTKLISGVVIGAAIILSILFFKLAWLIMVGLLSVIGTWELARMLNKRGHRVSTLLPMTLNALLLVSLYFLVDSDYSATVADWNVSHAQVLAWQNMFVLFSALTLILKTPFLRPRATVLELFAPLYQMAYLGWFPSFFILLRALPGGAVFLVWGLTVVAFSDIGAYFAGKYLGKHPYFQHLSPNKTIEGSVGGILASVAIAWGMAYFIGGYLPVSGIHITILAVSMACLGQVGDLIESMIKRDMQVKDSGTWLPGFGGLLDRIDSYLFLGPFMYYYLINFVLIKPFP